MRAICLLCLPVFLLLFNSGCDSANERAANTKVDFETVDREYSLKAYMTGYVGMGEDIEGIRNPTLRVFSGEVVKITIYNGEIMGHDICLDKGGISSQSILDEGDSVSIVFQVLTDDLYYCSIPGHRTTMEGKIKVEVPGFNLDVATGKFAMADGHKLNFDFEYNTLDDWTMTGKAFAGQPTSDLDTNSFWAKTMREVNSNGEYFVTSGGTKNYASTGTLTSEAFEITHPFASFKVAGGALKETRVELVDAESEEVIFEISGNNSLKFRPVVVDLQERIGQKMFIRLIDREDGKSPIDYIRDNIWAHISFDDFRFYETQPFFIDELHPEDIIVLPPLDVLPYSGLSGKEAAKAMELPENFSIQLAASEPEVVRPIAFAMDYRGRLWVVEGRTYPTKAPEGQGRDRILIFEDTNGDGILDKRIIFYEGLNLVSGIEIGHGGVWIGAAPELLYIPIDDSGSKPAGPPQVLLDGWGYQDTHETLNSFIWGPDGWLYGVHGVFTHSLVGKPGTPDSERIPINAGVWRFHPVTQEFEVFAWGTSNPWGLDFNEYGHAFVAVCVIPHLYHMIQGGRYLRQAGKHFNPYTYDDIKTIADHVHWAGDNGPHAGNFRSAAEGGGHAHAGGTIYQGAAHWPEEMRHSILMNNIHGARTNVDILVREGSGYKAEHGSDFVITNDFWSQWLDFQYGPGGSMYVIDWYDKNQCHSPNPDVHDKTLGRIFKISHKEDQFVQIDLSKKSDLELVEYQLHPNEWYVRQSRLLLQERGGSPEIFAALRKILEENPDVTRKLRALWTLHVTKGLTPEMTEALLDHENEYLRSWTIQLMTESGNVSENNLRKLELMAKKDPSKLVRLYISSCLQRLNASDKWNILEGLISHYGDINDHNLPLLNWYAFEPLIDLDGDRAIAMALQAEQPLILRYTIRKLGSFEDSKAGDRLKNLREKLEDKFSEEENHEIREELELALKQRG